MRLSHQMECVIKTAKEEPFRKGTGNFLINGEPITRGSLHRATSTKFDKFIYCGTCGCLLDHSQSSLDLTAAMSDIKTCKSCRQLEAHDDGFDDVPYSIQVFQEWRRGALALQKDPKKPKVRPKTPPKTPPMVLHLSPNFHEIHPVNYSRKPVRQGLGEKDNSPIRHPPVLEGDYSEKGWYRDLVQSEQPYRSPSKKFIKWVNGFGMQEPWERTLSAGDRLWLTSAASHNRTKRLQTDKVVPKQSAAFRPEEWSGFSPHEKQAVPLPPLRTRRMRSFWAGGQDAEHFIDRSRQIKKPF